MFNSDGIHRTQALMLVAKHKHAILRQVLLKLGDEDLPLLIAKQRAMLSTRKRCLWLKADEDLQEISHNLEGSVPGLYNIYNSTFALNQVKSAMDD